MTVLFSHKVISNSLQPHGLQHLDLLYRRIVRFGESHIKNIWDPVTVLFLYITVKMNRLRKGMKHFCDLL